MPLALSDLSPVAAERARGTGGIGSHCCSGLATMWFLWLLLIADFIAAGLYRFAPGLGNRLIRVCFAAEARPARYFTGFLIAAAFAYVPMALVFAPAVWFDLGPFAFQFSRPLHYAVYFFAGLGIGASGIERGLLGGCMVDTGQCGWLWGCCSMDGANRIDNDRWRHASVRLQIADLSRSRLFRQLLWVLAVYSGSLALPALATSTATPTAYLAFAVRSVAAVRTLAQRARHPGALVFGGILLLIGQWSAP
jgi:hypothetical protein